MRVRRGCSGLHGWRLCELAHAVSTGRGARGNREVPPCAAPRVSRGAGENNCGDRLMSEPLLDLRRVSMDFGGLHVISELDLHVDEGEIVSVIGPNGAGKTTLFNLVTGIYRPDAGEIVFVGESLRDLDPHEITARGIARTFQTLRLFLNMTVKENVI